MARTYKVSVHFPERLQETVFDSVSAACVEFTEAQRRSTGATKAVVNQVDDDGSQHPIARWERP